MLSVPDPVEPLVLALSLMSNHNLKSKRNSTDYERRRQEVGLLLETRSRQAARKISLRFGGRKRRIRVFRRRVMAFAFLFILLGILGILHEFFF